jgi:DNA polymerase-1
MAAGNTFLNDVNLHYVDTVDGAMQLMRWLGERHENDLVAVDTETTGLDPRDPGAAIRLIQFGDTKHGWAVPWENWRGLALEVFKKWEGTWGLWNLAFEAKWLSAHSPFTFPRDRTVDSMIGAHVIDPLGSGALKQNSVRYVDRRAAAGQGRLNEAFAANGWSWDTVPLDFGPYHQYAALDTVLTAGMWAHQKPLLTGDYKRVFDMEMAVRFIISKMETRGARVDLDYSREKYEFLTDYAHQIETWAKAALGINLGSTQQLAKVLTNYGVEITSTTPTGLPQVDKALLKIVANEDNGYSPDARMIATQTLRMRRSRKYASTYFANFLAKADGNSMIHADIRTLGARTGRMSISAPALQQCPKDSALVRNAFVPSEGNVILTCDYSQIEARLLAEFSKDEDLQRAFRTADETGGDFFVEVGKQVYADPSFTKKDRRRGLIKNVFYGKMYGAGAEKMAESAGIPVERMRDVVLSIEARFPGINQFMHKIEQLGKQREATGGQGYVVTPLGRRLPCDPNKTYTLTNYVIQSSAADILKNALIRLDAAGYDPFMALPVHDEVVFDIPREYAEQAERDVPQIMAELGHPVPLTADADGPFERWGEKYQ